MAYLCKDFITNYSEILKVKMNTTNIMLDALKKIPPLHELQLKIEALMEEYETKHNCTIITISPTEDHEKYFSKRVIIVPILFIP